jgi:hypothetical protein
MSAPLDHHFIPAFFLAQWAGANGKLIEYTKKAGKLIAKPVGPRATGFERELYSFPELPRDIAQFVEQEFLNYADRTASDALRLHLDGSSSQWTVELISAWSRFVIALQFRHPDAMPEFRVAAKSVWDESGAKYQKDYEAIKKPEDPPTFGEYLASRDPLTGTKMHVNMIIKIFDNEVLGKHLNNMKWGILDVSKSRHRFLLSCRPVCFANLREPEGVAYLPIGPMKMFVAANNLRTLQVLRSIPPRELVHNHNRFSVGRARRFVWAHDESQSAFVEKHMSTNLEPTPLFPGIGYHPDALN